MNAKLKNDIIDVLLYFEVGLADIQEGSGEEQSKLKEIRNILRRLKANGANTGDDRCHIQRVSNNEVAVCDIYRNKSYCVDYEKNEENACKYCEHKQTDC